MAKNDLAAKRLGLLVAISGEMYSCSISRVSEVFLEKVNGKWIGWRESFETGNSKSKGSKVIVKANTFNYALQEIEGYLNFIKSKKVTNK